jgi:hypothetical protein
MIYSTESGTSRQPDCQIMGDKDEKLVEGVDYQVNEDGYFVFTRTYLLKRGYCCESGCLNCPYGYRKGTEGSEG